MDEDTKHLVDEFDKLNIVKKELEEKIGKLRDSLIVFAQQKNTDVLFGTHKKCSIKSYDKVIYPEDKVHFVQLIKSKGLYDQFSSLNYLKLGPKIIRGEIDKEIIALVKKEKAYRLSLIDCGL